MYKKLCAKKNFLQVEQLFTDENYDLFSTYYYKNRTTTTTTVSNTYII